MKLPNTPIARRLSQLITRWEKVPLKSGGMAHRYYSQCTIDGCGREISLQKYQSRQKGNLKCRSCSKIKGYVHSVPVHAQRVWNLRRKILEFRTVDGRLQPFIKCAQHGCKEPVMLRNEKYHAKGSAAAGRCVNHRICAKGLSPYQSHYNILKRQAQKRMIPFALPFREFVALFTAPTCHYCDAENTRTAFSLKKTQSLGIDRKDSTIGYAKKNCVSCCARCNFAKNSFLTYEEMLVVGAIRSQNLAKARRCLSAVNLRKNVASIRRPYDRTAAALKLAWAKKKAREADSGLNG